MLSLRHAAVATIVVTLVAACGPSQEPGPASAPSPTPSSTTPRSSPSPSPSPSLTRVRGETTLDVVDVGHDGSGLFPPGSDGDATPARDSDAVTAFGSTVAATIDERLTAAVREGSLRLREQPTYSLEATASGGPEWLMAEVDSHRGRHRLLFAPGADGTARLLASDSDVLSPTRPPAGRDAMVLLLLGADRGPPRAGSPLRANADAFHLLFVSADRRHATIVNVPRDSWVPVPGRGRAKINACLSGGPQRCVATVESLWGLEVDGWLTTSMTAFLRAVDAVGGVEIDVERPLTDGGVDITRTGPQLLSGGQALTYARDRKHRPDGDLGRTHAQGVLLAALHEQLRAGTDLPRLVELLAVVRRHTVTDLPPGTLAELGVAALRLDPDNVEVVTLPASVGSAGAASVVFLGDAATDILADAAADGRLRP